MAADTVTGQFNSTNSVVSPDEARVFFRAAGKGDNEAVRAFLDKYPDAADIAAEAVSSIADKTALMHAAIWGREDTGLLLLERGAEVNALDRNCKSALTWAISNSHVKFARLLLEKGADPYIEDMNGNKLRFYADQSGVYETGKLLDEAPAIHERYKRRQAELQAAREKAEADLLHAEWLRETSCSQGLVKPLSAPSPLKLK